MRIKKAGHEQLHVIGKKTLHRLERLKYIRIYNGKKINKIIYEGKDKSNEGKNKQKENVELYVLYLV